MGRFYKIEEVFIFYKRHIYLKKENEVKYELWFQKIQSTYIYTWRQHSFNGKNEAFEFREKKLIVFFFSPAEVTIVVETADLTEDDY